MTKIQPTSTLKSLIKIILVLLILQVIFGFVIPLILDFRSGVGGALYYWPVMTRKEFETRRLLFKYLTPSERIKLITISDKTIPLDGLYATDLKKGGDEAVYALGRINKNGYCDLGGKYASWYIYLDTYGFAGYKQYVMTCNNGILNPYVRGNSY